MPCFYFHVIDGVPHRDDDGVELPDTDAARRLAIRHMAEILMDAARRSSPSMDWRVEVTNQDGLVLFALATLACDAPALRQFQQ